MSYDVTIDVRVLSSKNAFIAINSDGIDEAYYHKILIAILTRSICLCVLRSVI